MSFSDAQSYDRFMGRWSRSLAPLLVRFAAVRDCHTALDIGCGTGALAAALASDARCHRVIGIDPAPAYIATATSRHGSAHITFEVGDAQEMRFGAGTFDFVASLLAFNFIPDPRKTLHEIERVTKPMGTVASAVWDYGGGMEMLRVFWDEVIALSPESTDKDERNMPFCRRGELTALWTEQGFEGVVEEPLTIETVFASFDDYWTPFLEKQGPAGAYVASLTDTARDVLRSRLRRRLLGAGDDRPVVLHARAWAVRGTVR